MLPEKEQSKVVWHLDVKISDKPSYILRMFSCTNE